MSPPTFKPEEADGRSIVVMFVCDEDSWLVWGTAEVADGELILHTDEAERPVPLPGGSQRLRRTDGQEVFEDAEFVTAVYVPPLPPGGPPPGSWYPGLRLSDGEG